jgi:hypothetical protein
LFGSKTVELVLNTSSFNVNFTLHYEGIPEGLKPEICQFSLNFSDNSDARRVKITFEQDGNQMFSKVSAVEIKEQ